MAISHREMRLVYITVAVVLGFVLWVYGVRPTIENYQELANDLETEEAEYERNVGILARTAQIEADYRRVEATFPQEDDRNPDDAFSEDVDAAAQQILPDSRREILPVKAEEIKGVPGYEFLTLTLSSTGNLENISQLLKGFDQKGFLIKSLTLQHSRGLEQADQLKLDVTLARIVKIEEPEPSASLSRPGFRRPGGDR